MRKFPSLVLAFSLIGSALTGATALANERFDRPGDERVEMEQRRMPIDPVVVPSRTVVERPRYAPPIAPIERAPRLRGYVWVNGEYSFLDGQYVFIPGHYEKVRRGFRYAPSSWVRRGHSYMKIAGRWQRG